MKDRVLVYAIGISVLVHLLAICVIGLKSGHGFATASIMPAPKSVAVDLVASPDDALKPQSQAVAYAPNQSDPYQTRNPQDYGLVAPTVSNPMTGTTYVPPVPGNPAPAPAMAEPGSNMSLPSSSSGGPVDVGSLSTRGDMSADWGSGHSPVGYVPSERGNGMGSGTEPGIGTPQPPVRVVMVPTPPPTPVQPVSIPVVRPVPVPVPPAPRTVTARVCSDSGMLAGPNCEHVQNRSFVEGTQPGVLCSRCKAPQPYQSSWADRANPEIIKDPRVSLPASVPEGLSATVVVEYTVTAEGNVTDVKVTRSSGNRAADKAIIAAASGMKYRPAVQNGVPRSVKMSRAYKI